MWKHKLVRKIQFLVHSLFKLKSMKNSITGKSIGGGGGSPLPNPEFGMWARGWILCARLFVIVAAVACSHLPCIEDSEENEYYCEQGCRSGWFGRIRISKKVRVPNPYFEKGSGFAFVFWKRFEFRIRISKNGRIQILSKHPYINKSSTSNIGLYI